MNWLDYQRPKSVSEALTLLAQAEGKGRVIAGGTDLVLKLRQGRYQADLLVDITGIKAYLESKDISREILLEAARLASEEAKNEPVARRR